MVGGGEGGRERASHDLQGGGGRREERLGGHPPSYGPAVTPKQADREVGGSPYAEELLVEKFCEEDEEEVECRQYTVTLFLSSGGIIGSVGGEAEVYNIPRSGGGHVGAGWGSTL